MVHAVVWSNLAFWLSCVYGAANAACPSFTINYPSMRTLLCPGDTITYTCALSSTFITVTTQWSGSGFTCTPTGLTANAITLTQSPNSSLNTVPLSCGSLSAVMTNVSGTCYTSVLTIPTPQYYNGTTVLCKDGTTGAANGNDILNVQLASLPSALNITSLTSTYSNITVTWTPVPTATSYNVSINGSSPNSLPANVNTYTFPGLTNNTVYTVSVVAINCAGNSSAVMVGKTNKPSSSSPLADSTTIMVPLPSSVGLSTLVSTIPTAITAVPTSTNGPPAQTSSSSAAVGIGVGVSLGIIVLLAAAIAVVVVVIVVHRRGPPASPMHTDAKEEVNKIHLPPKSSSTVPKSEGMIYADIGLPKRLPLQAPAHAEETTVTYSTVQAARST